MLQAKETLLSGLKCNLLICFDLLYYISVEVVDKICVFLILENAKPRLVHNIYIQGVW